jgi:hypothetical protein
MKEVSRVLPVRDISRKMMTFAAIMTVLTGVTMLFQELTGCLPY